jgi:hypothetical protein
VDVAWEVAEDGEADVDQEVGAAAGEEEDGDGRNWGNLSALRSRCWKFGQSSEAQSSRT